MTQLSIVARLPVTKTAASSSDNRNPEPVMRSPRSVTSSAAIVTTLPIPLPRISAPVSPMSVSGLLIDDRARHERRLRRE